MIKQLGEFNLVSYDSKNKKHTEFKYYLLNDELFKQYFGDFFIKKSDEIFDESSNLEVKKAYLIEDRELIVGMIRLFSYHETGFVTLQYAVSPEYRKQGYGTKILKEISNYLFSNGIKCIDLDINKNNIGSIICAENCNYEKYEEKYRIVNKSI